MERLGPARSAQALVLGAVARRVAVRLALPTVAAPAQPPAPLLCPLRLAVVKLPGVVAAVGQLALEVPVQGLVAAVHPAVVP